LNVRKTLYLARHGETDWNAAGRWQGHTDVPLNVNGIAQSLVLAARVRRAAIAAVASSDLSRARVTAETAARELGLSVAYVDEGLRERAFGVFEGLTRTECETLHGESWARYLADPRMMPPGGEQLPALVGRMRAAVLRAAEQLASPALLVSHGGAIRAIVRDVRGEAVGPVPNAAVYRIAVEAERIVDAELVEGEIGA
jgi:probable phosphoglycerate mutase